MSGVNWTEANRQILAAEFGRLRARLTATDPASAEQRLAETRATIPAPAAIDLLSRTFELSTFERDLLLLCAGVEMDPAFAAQVANGGNPASAGVTFSFALDKLADPHWSAVSPVRPLRLMRLVELRDERAPLGSRLQIDERVLHYLAGINYIDPRLRSLVRAHHTSALLGERQASLVDSIAAALEPAGRGAPIVQLNGDDPAGQLEVARQVAERFGLQLHVLRAADIPGSPHELDAASLLWQRDSMLLGSALCVQVDEVDPAAAGRFVQQLGGLNFITSRHPLALEDSVLSFRVDRPSRSEQKRLWAHALGDMAPGLNGSLDAIASQFRLRTDVIVRTADALRSDSNTGSDAEASLWKLCRESVRHRLADLSQRIDPVARWEDLVLPEPQLATLRQVVAHVRHRAKVYEAWGFAGKCARGLGISVLFTGESGTGKTMASEVLANELHLDLYRIDLSAMVSKYIGETEKNLRRVFDAAEDSGAILLFDEADALFGKRSEVKDSHDRYANIEVSYLLQRMEAYGGLAILTTNLKGSLDSAFQRRLRFVVQFPFPDSQLRERIWRGVFPGDTPLDAMEYTKLARLNVAGGNIRNIALNAAFLAAETSTSLNMSHLLQAAHGEAAKRDRPCSEAETRGWT